MLVEFASVIAAVRCAVEVQHAMPERNTGVAAESRIELRIGINLGDVIVEGEDLYGEGVNVAARLETLADVGGVFASNTVYDHVRDRLPFVFEDLGEQQLKNIARPVRVYQVCNVGTAAKIPLTPTVSVLPLPDKPSVAVLPFTNIGGDAEQEFSLPFSRIPASCAREETAESRGMPCLFLNTEQRGIGFSVPFDQAAIIIVGRRRSDAADQPDVHIEPPVRSPLSRGYDQAKNLLAARVRQKAVNRCCSRCI